MQVDIIPSINEARSDDFLHHTVVVIDVLRATSCMATAIEHGCNRIIPVETVIQAKQMKEDGLLLGGERFCKKIPGFDFGNSPFDYMDDRVRGATVIMSTTNGTRAIQKSLKASHVLTGCILNASACARAALSFEKDVKIVCAGTQDQFSLEDGLGAGLMLHELLKLRGDLDISDFGLAMHSAYLHVRDSLEQTLFQSKNGKKLQRLGFAEDVRFCARPNVFDTVPIMQGDALVAFRPGSR